ncbi:MAG: hypothetical protein JW878_05585 [Methanomicrobia archaeon]|nr:hypothetical protein [Methanomicrobia archaeon]
MDWKDTIPGDSPVCLVGAGFQKAALKEPMPSTEDIIEETVNNNGELFPILSALCNGNIAIRLDLNYIWGNIAFLSKALMGYYQQIREDYLSLNNMITKVIEEYERYIKNDGLTILDSIAVVLELELKNMIAYHYDFNKIGDFKESVVDNMNSIISKGERFTWISLNYDIILEKLLVSEIYRENEFNLDVRQVKYSFDSLLTNKSSKTADSEHLLIKPHGSLNVVFETDNQNTAKKIHKLYYTDENNYFDTFDWTDMGYNLQQNKINEKRPWMIGYLPDDLKAELNSKAYFSDLAHDLCKWNMAYSSFALEKATSLFILGTVCPMKMIGSGRELEILEIKKSKFT